MNTMLYRTRLVSLAVLTRAVVDAHPTAHTETSGSSPLLSLGRSLLEQARCWGRRRANPRG